VEVASHQAAGTLTASAPGDADPSDYDLVALAMQEPQYRHPAVNDLLNRTGAAGVPVMSIMNMPPLPYLGRLPGMEKADLGACYTDPSVWSSIDPTRITLASPDPQAFRPPDEPLNVLQVSLPTNFKVARFVDEAPTALLRQLEADIADVRFKVDGEAVELPVKLKVHDSVFVPLAKWAMLLTGNYRCVTADGSRAIREAVHQDPAASRAIYDWVCELCRAMGADASDLVPFEKYAAAAQGLAKPSSAARALDAGAQAIERVDRLVQTVAAARGMSHPEVDRIVETIDARLEKNRRHAA
jgi:hypothetical protein